MARWTFEPGHTAAEFAVRHMMVTWVRGHFKDVHGTIEFDPGDLRACSVEAVIQARKIWTGDPERDDHLRSHDFLDVDDHPEIRFRGNEAELLGSHEMRLLGDLAMRGVTLPVSLDVTYLGQWNTPWWEDGVDKGPRTRAGFVATTTLDRHDFGVSWNANLDRGGIVVGNSVHITIDVEAMLDAS